nr:hypothetical protein [Oscillospiraceae bacterium]
MAKKDSFSFDSEGSSFSLKQKISQWEENLTQKQKVFIIAIAVAVVVIIISVVCICVATSGNTNGNSNSGGDNNQGDTNSGDENHEIINMYISATPNRSTYYVGDTADYSGLKLAIDVYQAPSYYVSYEENSEDFTINGFDSSAPTESQVITVEYKGFTATFMVKILEVPLTAPTLQSIYLSPVPKSTCKVGRSPSVRDARLVCVYSDGSEESIPLAYSHLYDYEEDLMAAQVGDTVTIRVRYSEDGYVAETSYTVTIVE